MSEISDEIRESFKENDDKRDAGYKTPENIIRFDDILYGDDEKWQVLDVYRPRNTQGCLPVIVSVHGGAWVYGDKERYQYYCMELAGNGFAVVNFSYRLAPEYKFPAPVEDTALVFQWIKDNRDKYGFDVDNIFAVGDSAGANILSSYILMITCKEYKDNMLNTYDMSFENILPKAVALNCGVYRPGDKDIMNVLPELMSEGGTSDELEFLNIPGYITKDFPPAYLMTSGDDFLKEQPMLMAKEFTEKKVPFVYRMYGDNTNILYHIFHCDIKTKYAKLCNDDECNFFKSFIIGG